MSSSKDENYLRRINNCRMKLEEAIAFLLANAGCGMRTEHIAREINAQGLFTRWDKEPVSDPQVFACVMSHPCTFVKTQGLVRLLL